MGASTSRNNGRRAYSKRELRSFSEKVRAMEEEISGMMKERERETKSYRRDVMMFALKEAEWRKERRKLREEVKRLEKKVSEEEENGGGGGGSCNERELMERMREERARRDEAVEKWKQLYLAIKMELDDLIRSAHYGDRVCWGSEEEEMMEELKKQVMAREGTIESLRSRLASLEQEKHKLETEMDILRQSLRIISNNKQPTNTTKNKSLA